MVQCTVWRSFRPPNYTFLNVSKRLKPLNNGYDSARRFTFASDEQQNMVAKTYGAALHGVDAHAITIEVSVGQGINTYLVGLPDSAVKESLMRVEIAIKSDDKER